MFDVSHDWKIDFWWFEVDSQNLSSNGCCNFAISRIEKFQTVFQVVFTCGKTCGKTTEEVRPSNARWKAMRMTKNPEHANHFGKEEEVWFFFVTEMRANLSFFEEWKNKAQVSIGCSLGMDCLFAIVGLPCMQIRFYR